MSLLATSSLYLSKFNEAEDKAEADDDTFTPSYVEKVAFSPSGLYAIYVELLLLMYTVVPLPLIGTLVIGVVYRYDNLFELLYSFCNFTLREYKNNSKFNSIIPTFLQHCL